MTHQIKHLRKMKKAGRGADIGKFKVGDIIVYKNEEMLIKSKKIVDGKLIYILLDDDKDLWEVTENKLWK